MVPPNREILKIGTRKDHSIEVAVKKDQTLNVEFLVESKDIGFALYVKVGSSGDVKKDRKEIDKFKLKKN